ncbi:MAG: hypothetical protein EBE86_027330 [Hormoscilla sp. GUM202]|nr:hypothetical protein [Hormoscilla sp. GUM202]
MRTKNGLAFSSLVTWLCTGLIALMIGFNSNAAPAKAEAIYHAFDECLADVQAKLPEIQEAGYTYIRNFPPNATLSREDDPCTSDKYWYWRPGRRSLPSAGD